MTAPSTGKPLISGRPEFSLYARRQYWLMDTEPKIFPTNADVPIGKKPIPGRYLYFVIGWLRDNRPEFFTDAETARAAYLESLRELCGTYDADAASRVWARFSVEPTPGTRLEDASGWDLRLQALANLGYARDRRARGRRRAEFPGYWLDAALNAPWPWVCESDPAPQYPSQAPA